MVIKKKPIRKKFVVFGSIGSGAFYFNNISDAKRKAKSISKQKKFGYHGFITNLQNQRIFYRSYEWGDLV